MAEPIASNLVTEPNVQAKPSNPQTQSVDEDGLAKGGENTSAEAETDYLNSKEYPQKPDHPSNSTVGGAKVVADARSPSSPGARMRGPQGSDILAMPTIASIKVTVQAILGGIQMPVSQLADLKQGELISLDSNIGDVIDITANGQLIARGEIVVIEEGVPRFGITLTEII